MDHNLEDLEKGELNSEIMKNRILCKTHQLYYIAPIRRQKTCNSAGMTSLDTYPIENCTCDIGPKVKIRMKKIREI